MLKKATSGVPCLRRAYSAEVALATKAGSGYAQAGRHFVVLTYWKYAPRVKKGDALRDATSNTAAFPSVGSGQDWTNFFDHPRRLTGIEIF
jgi:hypothetical protein